MKNTEIKVGLRVINSLKMVGVITNICEKENTITVMWSDGSFTDYDCDSLEYCPPDILGDECDEALLILLETLKRIERLHNE